MKGFLLVQEGPLSGLVVRLEDNVEWIIGRDPDVCQEVIEDPMVSRKHVIVRASEKEFSIENLSAVNPASINGKPITAPTALHEGDIVQIGSIFLTFTLTDPAETHPSHSADEESETPTIFDEPDRLDAFSFTADVNARWVLKVTSGPNAGAEFGLSTGSTHILGKDPHTCDIVFQDLSVSRQHARLSLSAAGTLTIDDMGSRNGVFINGMLIKGPTHLSSQDVISLGTTILLVIDREKTQETIIATPIPAIEEKKEAVSVGEEVAAPQNWKQMFIPRHHLVLALAFLCLVVFGVGSILTLFKSEPILVEKMGETKVLEEHLASFPSVEFSFNESTGKLFLLGHLLSQVDHQELLYLVRTLPFVTSVEDNIIIDELVWENTNAMLMKYPEWRGVSLTSSKPGSFILRGYIQDPDQAAALDDWMNSNFPYVDKLTNSVVVENTLNAQIQSILTRGNFVNVTYQLTNGELVLTGRVNDAQESEFEDTLAALKKTPGVRDIKNFVILTSATTDFVDVSNKYEVTGSSKLGNISQFIVINGKILSKGDALDGMTITDIEADVVFLEKDGLKYRINYNQQ